MVNRLKNQEGFSLVELIVVIAIMVILIAMLVPNVVGYIKKANWATEQNGASTVFSAAQTYVTDYYAKYGENPAVPTLEALKDANLLTKAPAIKYSIYLANDADAAVDYVEWSSKNSPDGSLGRYPIN